MTTNTENENSNTDNSDNGAEVKKYSEAEVAALIEEKTTGLKSKVDELLGEKKSASQKAKEAEAAAAAERERRAKDEGDHKALFESSEAKRSELQTKFDELRNGIRAEKRTSEAMRLASQLASGNNAELLAEFIGKRIDIADDGKVVILNAEGGPTVSTLDDLRKEIEGSGKYDSLINGTKSTGGGAARSTSGGAGTGTDISKMTRGEKLAYYRQKREE